MTTVLDATTVPGARALYRVAVILAAVSGAFCLLFCAVLVVNYHGLLSPGGAATPAGEIAPPTSDPSYRLPAMDFFNRLPTDYHSFLALRHALAQDRQNDEIRAQIRQLDHELRIDYFQRRTTIERTTILLIAASILFFVAMRTISVLKRQLPEPGSLKARKSAQGKQSGSWHFAVVISWLMLFGGLYVGLLLAPSPQMEQIFVNRLVVDADADALPGMPVPPAVQPAVQPGVQPGGIGQVGTGQPVILPVATPAESAGLTREILAQNWVSFRNFDGNGIGFSDNPPIHWDGTTGKNIVWQSEIPLPGNSSPVIWTDSTGGGKLFLTGADEETQMIFCYNIENGELLWSADVTRPEAPMPSVYPCTGFAAPTPVVDGRHVYAMFANGELVAVDFSGNLVWRKSFGIPDNVYGFASSPALYFDRLIVQFDDGEGIVRLPDGGTETTSRLVALDLSTGEVIWETARDMPNTWASPTIKRIGDSYQIITNANPYVIAYNPENGEELWRVRCLSGDVGPSAVSLGDVVMITNISPRTTVIDATGRGNIATTHVLWTGGGATPETPSPLATETYFLMLSDGGWLTGYDPTVIDPARQRARFWELEIGNMASFYSSPILVGTYVYMFSKTPFNEARGTQPEAFVVDLSKVAVGEDGMLTDESAAAMIIAVNPMPEPIVASPAILNNRIYIRGERMLYSIGDPAVVPAVATPAAVTPTETTPAAAISATPAAPARLPDARLTDEALVQHTDETLAQHWVSFRNFDGNGIGFADNPPIHWDGTTGENILWQSEVPLPGTSSPVLWTDDQGGGKLFLSGADEESQKIFCYNMNTGELLWTADVTRPEAPMPSVYPCTGFAAPTPVVDGRHVYAMFANGELVAVDFAGNLVWRKSFGIPDNVYGFSSSPALFFDRLIVQFDDGDGTEGNSRLVALDLGTGDVIWETPRDLGNTWASPTIKRINGSYQIITNANPYVIAYNPENGEELWRVRCLAGDVGPSAVSFGNVVLITNDFPRTTAIDATGTGNITATHILWTGGGATPDTASPLMTEDHILMLSSGGWLTGYDPTVRDARQRARFWELEIGDMASFYSSPLLVGTYVYIFSKTPVNEARGTQPEAFVVDLSKVVVDEDGMLTDESAAAMIIAVNPMPEPVVTSPAILNNRIFVRGETMVYSIGEN